MYVGHFAIGLALKARFPEVPPLPIVLGVGVLDLIDGALILCGINKVTPNLDAGPALFFDLTFIDWDHSLLMAVVWSLVWAALFSKNKTVSLVAGAAALSHWLADWPVHDDDLALYPHAAAHFGLGMWPRLGIYSWILEGLFAAVLAGYAWRAARARGESYTLPVALLAVLFVQLSPWLSPMKAAAMMAEPGASQTHALLVIAGFLLPGLLLVQLLRRAAAQRRPPATS